MICSDLFIALSSAALAVAFITMESVPTWFIYCIIFARGIGMVFHGISFQASIPLFTPTDKLVQVGGWGQIVNGAANLIGPALGALLIMHLSMEYVMYVDIFGAVSAVVCLLLVKFEDVAKNAEEQAKSDFGGEFKQGIRTLKANKPLLIATTHGTITGSLYFPLNALFLLLVAAHYGGTELQASYVEVAAAAGVIIGALIIGKIGDIKYKLRTFSLSIIFVGISTFIMGILPSSLFGFCVVLVLLFGIAIPFFQVPYNTYVQTYIPKEEMGRVFSVYFMLCCIGNPIGLLLDGPIGDKIGVASMFVYLGILLALNGLICLIRVRLPEKDFIRDYNKNNSSENNII